MRSFLNSIMPPRRHLKWLPFRRKKPSFGQSSSSTTPPADSVPSTNQPSSSTTSPAPSIPSINQPSSSTISLAPGVAFTGTGDAADRVFHTLELAQQIVYELKLCDLFRALPVTKELWESKVPDRVWIDHLKHLGYPDYVIRNTSHCLRICLLSISQAVVGIRGCVAPVFKRTKMETIQKKRYMRSSCAQQMEPSFVLQSSHRHGGGDLYILDGDDLSLVKTDVLALPSNRVFNGSHVTATENSESLAVRRLDNWSLTATYPNNPYYAEHTDSGTRDWHFYDKFIVSIYLPSANEAIENDLIEFWDQQGLKRGESIIFDRKNSVPTSIHGFGNPNFSCLLPVHPYLRETDGLLPGLRCDCLISEFILGHKSKLAFQASTEKVNYTKRID